MPELKDDDVRVGIATMWGWTVCGITTPTQTCLTESGAMVQENIVLLMRPRGAPAADHVKDYLHIRADATLEEWTAAIIRVDRERRHMPPLAALPAVQF